ncbi:hypothetical protein PTI98_004046 [Pleurotus ostreatus]|nr:hypothetical protein PTI98_004046 [Pleurotus ostreatus]
MGWDSSSNSIASTCRSRISVSHTINSSADESWTYPAVYHEQGACPPRSLFSFFWYNLQATAVRHHDGRYVRRHSSREKFPYHKNLSDRHTLEGRLRRRPIVTVIF